MIIYSSSRAVQHYDLVTVDRLSRANAELGRNLYARNVGDALQEWCLDVFRFLGRDCIVLVNRATDFTLFFYGVDKGQLDNIGNILAQCLISFYSGDRKMLLSLLRMFEEEKYIVFSTMKKRSMMDPVNRTIADYARGGDRFFDYIDYNNVLHLRQFNYDVNYTRTLSRTMNDIEIHYTPGSYFRQLITDRYYSADFVPPEK